MLNSVYAIDLELKQSDIKCTDIILTQGDNSAIIFNIHIRDGANEIDYSQATARIVFMKEDKTSVQKELSFLPEKAGYSYKVGSNEISAIGKVVCSVLLYGENGERLSASRFIFHVQADMLSATVVDSSTEMDALAKAINLLKQVEDRMAQSGNQTILGDLTVKHPNKLYASFLDAAPDSYGLFINYNNRGQINTSSIVPFSTSEYTIGSPSYYFKDIYLQNAPIVLSDERLKNSIANLNEDTIKAFIMALNPSSYTLKDSGRTHWGLISQQVMQALTKAGLSDSDFGGWVKSPIYEDGQENLPENERNIVDYKYMLRYEEFIAPMLTMIQSQQHIIEDLVTRIKALETNEIS